MEEEEEEEEEEEIYEEEYVGKGSGLRGGKWRTRAEYEYIGTCVLSSLPFRTGVVWV